MAVSFWILDNCFFILYLCNPWGFLSGVKKRSHASYRDVQGFHFHFPV